MTTLYLLCGLPFSGKSLLSKEIENTTSIKRISFDEMWDAFDKSNVHSPYKIVRQKAKDVISENLKAKISVVYDSTNLQSEHRDEFKKLAEEAGAKFEIIYLQNSIDEIKKRRALSLINQTHHIVQDKDFDSAFSRLEPPTDAIIISNEEEKNNFLKNIKNT